MTFATRPDQAAVWLTFLRFSAQRGPDLTSKYQIVEASIWGVFLLDSKLVFRNHCSLGRTVLYTRRPTASTARPCGKHSLATLRPRRCFCGRGQTVFLIAWNRPLKQDHGGDRSEVDGTGRITWTYCHREPCRVPTGATIHTGIHSCRVFTYPLLPDIKIWNIGLGGGDTRDIVDATVPDTVGGRYGACFGGTREVTGEMGRVGDPGAAKNGRVPHPEGRLWGSLPVESRQLNHIYNKIKGRLRTLILGCVQPAPSRREYCDIGLRVEVSRHLVSVRSPRPPTT